MARGRRRYSRSTGTVTGGRPRGGGGPGGVGYASFNGANECPRCGRDMLHTRDMTKTARGVWIHKTCAAGADDT